MWRWWTRRRCTGTSHCNALRSALTISCSFSTCRCATRTMHTSTGLFSSIAVVLQLWTLTIVSDPASTILTAPLWSVGGDVDQHVTWSGALFISISVSIEGLMLCWSSELLSAAVSDSMNGMKSVTMAVPTVDTLEVFRSDTVRTDATPLRSAVWMAMSKATVI